MPSPPDQSALARVLKSARSTADQIAAKIDRTRDARALFCDSKGGLKPEAVRLLRRLEGEARAGKTLFRPDPYAQARLIGRMEVVEILADMVSYPTNKIEYLINQHREIAHE